MSLDSFGRCYSGAHCRTFVLDVASLYSCLDPFISLSLFLSLRSFINRFPSQGERQSTPFRPQRLQEAVVACVETVATKLHTDMNLVKSVIMVQAQKLL